MHHRLCRPPVSATFAVLAAEVLIVGVMAVFCGFESSGFESSVDEHASAASLASMAVQGRVAGSAAGGHAGPGMLQQPEP